MNSLHFLLPVLFAQSILNFNLWPCIYCASQVSFCYKVTEKKRNGTSGRKIAQAISYIVDQNSRLHKTAREKSSNLNCNWNIYICEEVCIEYAIIKYTLLCCNKVKFYKYIFIQGLLGIMNATFSEICMLGEINNAHITYFSRRPAKSSDWSNRQLWIFFTVRKFGAQNNDNSKSNYF